jgi:hypothetical protein
MTGEQARPVFSNHPAPANSGLAITHVNRRER